MTTYGERVGPTAREKEVNPPIQQEFILYSAGDFLRRRPVTISSEIMFRILVPRRESLLVVSGEIVWTPRINLFPRCWGLIAPPFFEGLQYSK